MDNEFKWNDDLATEFAVKCHKGEFPIIPGKSFLDLFKASKQASNIPIKDYKILKCKGGGTGNHIHDYYPDICLGANTNATPCTIYSVGRLSDGEVFSVGDKLKSSLQDYVLVDSFFIENGNLFVKYSNAHNKSINHVEKLKQPEPLFTSNDGKEIFEGDMFWMVFTAPNGIGNPHETKARKELLPLQCYQKTFSTKDACDEWLLMNKPYLSVNDFLGWYKARYRYAKVDKEFTELLKMFVKSKLNQ